MCIYVFQTIQVGSCFQAVVPEGLSMYGDAPGNHSFFFICKTLRLAIALQTHFIGGAMGCVRDL